MPLISIIIPVYNVEKYLEKCVESVLSQTFNDYEIILVDDGSTDKSGKMCDEYSKKCTCIKTVHQPNKGLGGARNTGIENSTGKYLVFVDSDDWIKNDMLEYLVEKAESTDADIICFGMDYVDDAGNTIHTILPTEKDEEIFTLSEYAVFPYINPYTWNKMYKCSLFVESGIKFPERLWYEDLCTTPKLMLKANKFLLLNKSFYQYLQRSNSIMHEKNADRNMDMITAVSSVIDYYKANDAFEKYYQPLCFMAVMHVMVLATLRVAIIDVKHKLLNEFYEFTYFNFPDYKKNSYVNQHLTARHKIVFWLSKHRFYNSINLLGKLNNLRR